MKDVDVEIDEAWATIGLENVNEKAIKDEHVRGRATHKQLGDNTDRIDGPVFQISQRNPSSAAIRHSLEPENISRF